jgi:hypothetical protein
VTENFALAQVLRGRAEEKCDAPAAPIDRGMMSAARSNGLVRKTRFCLVSESTSLTRRNSSA